MVELGRQGRGISTHSASQKPSSRQLNSPSNPALLPPALQPPPLPYLSLLSTAGKNYVESEVFRQRDACQVAKFAATTPWVRSTSLWSVGRDQFVARENNTVSSGSSGIPQGPYEFCKIFNGRLVLNCTVPS